MSKCFKGNQKNRNKKLNKEDRRLMHTKKRSKKKFDVKVVARNTLESYAGDKVTIKGRLLFLDRKDHTKATLVGDVIIDGIRYDHIWVKFTLVDKKKLRLCEKGCVILFSGTVYRYSKRSDRQVSVKYGIRQPELVKE